LIVDGASSDGKTIEVAEEYVQHHSYAKVFSEKDSGISDALNKGVRLSSGESVIFMNAGDTFHTVNSLRDITNASASLKSPFALYGQAELIYPSFTTPRKRLNHRLINSAFQFWNPICHQSALVSKELLAKFTFSNSLKYSMDLELWIRLFDEGVPFHESSTIFCNYEVGGISSDPKNYMKIVDEHLKVYCASGRWYKALPAFFVRVRYGIEMICGAKLQAAISHLRKTRRNR